MTGSHHADQLKRFYRLRSPSPTASSSRDVGFIDYARGEGVLSSSGSEDEESEVEEEELELGAVKRVLPGLEMSEESEDESESDEDRLNIDLSEDEVPTFPAEEDGLQEEEEEKEAATPTNRVAAVNLDWDNLRATDLFAAFISILKSDKVVDGKLVNVSIYPSEFGKGRMEKEEAEGPGGGIFAGKAGKGKKDRRKEGLVRQQDLESEDQEDEAEEEGVQDDEPDEDENADEDELDVEDDEDDAETDCEGEDGFSGEDEDAGPRKNDHKEIDRLEIISDISSEAGEDDIDMDQLRKYQLERLRFVHLQRFSPAYSWYTGITTPLPPFRLSLLHNTSWTNAMELNLSGRRT